VNDAVALYNLSPILQLLLLGAVLALGPLVWVTWRQRHAAPATRLRTLTLITLFLTFDLVLFGAFTRLTDSGLGCPDWPGCYGSATPLGASEHITAAQSAMPTGPVTWSKAWIEMIHRYFASAVGALILALAFMGWRYRRELPVSPAWAWVTLLWVCLQGAFGAWTVTMKLFPAIVTLHLLGGLGLLALLRIQATAYGVDPFDHRSEPWRPSLRRGLWVVMALTLLQIALGGWVSTNYAVLACSDFPTCQGQWWPAMDWARGFTLWRELGVDHQGDAIPFAALTAIHYAHRISAYVVILAVWVFAWAAHRQGHRRLALSLLGLTLWQFLSGLTNVVLDWPLIAAVAHTAGAAGLVIVLAGAWAQGLVRPATFASLSSR
jgi:cytochrome c oxidase assembly protein subunit 15